jgi:hypothetical protein
MIRPIKYVTETCRCCNRDGWTRRVQYSLFTEEEYGNPIVVKGLPRGYTPLMAYAGSSVYDAVKEAIEFCQTYAYRGAGFEFNGKTVVVTSAADADKIAGKWWKDVYGETQAESFAKR